MTNLHITSLGAFYDLELANRHDDTMDYACWYEAYFRGYCEPHYQVPAPYYDLRITNRTVSYWSSDGATRIIHDKMTGKVFEY